jgi:hypothetical protein
MSLNVPRVYDMGAFADARAAYWRSAQVLSAASLTAVAGLRLN